MDKGPMRSVGVDGLWRRYEQGESIRVLADEAGVSRVTVWRWLGRPARHRMGVPTQAPDAAFVAWAAGFFDGEGNVSIDRRGLVQLEVSQTVPEPLFALQEAFGGHVRGRDPGQAHHKEQWLWSIHGRAAGAFLHLIAPHLKVKHHHAYLALGAVSVIKGRGHRLDAFDLAERASFHEVIAVLNHRGRAAPSM
jgi:hypothetical protein